jgi:hypothetical protein
MISAIEFVDRYIEWLETIDAMIHESHYPAIRRMYYQDPHDLISPVACFTSEEHAIGFIVALLMKTHKQMQEVKANAN